MFYLQINGEALWQMCKISGNPDKVFEALQYNLPQIGYKLSSSSLARVGIAAVELVTSWRKSVTHPMATSVAPCDLVFGAVLLFIQKKFLKGQKKSLKSCKNERSNWLVKIINWTRRWKVQYSYITFYWPSYDLLKTFADTRFDTSVTQEPLRRQFF